MIVLKVTMEKSLMQKGVEGQTFRAFDIQVPYLICLIVIMHLIVRMLVVKLTMQRALRGGRKSAPIVENNRGLTLSQLLSTSWWAGWSCWWSWPKQHCLGQTTIWQFWCFEEACKLYKIWRSAWNFVKITTVSCGNCRSLPYNFPGQPNRQWFVVPTYQYGYKQAANNYENIIYESKRN